jgi:hypothetical protein
MVTLIARADLALSVVMTTVSTLAAVLLTPLITGLLAGHYVPVEGWKLLFDVLQVVLLLVVLGVALKRGVPRLSRRLAPVMPPPAMLADRGQHRGQPAPGAAGAGCRAAVWRPCCCLAWLCSRAAPGFRCLGTGRYLPQEGHELWIVSKLFRCISFSLLMTATGFAIGAHEGS